MTEDRSNQPEMLSACQLCGSQLGEVELKSHLAANHFPLNCPTSSSSGQVPINRLLTDHNDLIFQYSRASQIDHMQNGEPSHSKVIIIK